MSCSEAEDGVHEDCCLHDLPEGATHFPGKVCCWCGDIYLDDSRECPEHGEYLPRVTATRKKTNPPKRSTKNVRRSRGS